MFSKDLLNFIRMGQIKFYWNTESFIHRSMLSFIYVLFDRVLGSGGVLGARLTASCTPEGRVLRGCHWQGGEWKIYTDW